MRRKCFLLMIMFFTVACQAQQDQIIDSLLTVLKDQKEDTGKVSTLNDLSERFLAQKNDSEATPYATYALQLAEKKNFRPGVLEANINLANAKKVRGNNNYYEGDYAAAVKNYFAALLLFEKCQSKKGIASMRRNIGLVYWKQNNYEEALKNHQLSLELWKELQEKAAIAIAYNDIGNTYENQGNYNDALRNYLLSLKLHEELGDKGAMINRYFNIAFLHEDQGNYDEALKSHLAALSISKEIENPNALAACYSNIGAMYEKQAKQQAGLNTQKILFNKALENYLLALEKNKLTGDIEGSAACYSSLGGLYFQLSQFPKAKQFLENGLALFKKSQSNDGETYQMPAAYIRDNYWMLFKTDSAMNSWKESLKHYQLYVYYRDSVANNETANKILKEQMQYDFDKKQDSLKYVQVLTAEKLKEQKQTKNYLFAALGLVIILSFFIYRNYRNRQQLKLQVMRNKIASDLHDDIGSTLSSISIFSQMAQQQSAGANPLLENIGDSTRKMLDAMSDIVWTIHPGNDQFEKIILRMRNFAYEMLGIKKIDFEFIADEPVVGMKLPMEARKNLYLIFKEATNNMVKYSFADKASFLIKEEKNNLVMTIQDNGNGFDSNKSTEGNGLRNMKKRAEEMGGELKIDSHPGEGTTIRLIVPVK